jgi:hypothetical protein
MVVLILLAEQSINTINSFNTITFSEHLLDISHYITYTSWGRNPVTDLPRCYSGINFTILNRDIEAVNAHLTVILDESSVIIDKERLEYGLNTITGTYIIGEYEDFDIDHSLRYYITAKTDTTFVYGYSTSTWKPTFPRRLDEEVASLYITPNNPETVDLEKSITKLLGWLSLCNWVANNIRYEYDSDVHGVSEYWQLPIETNGLRTGDCEDYAILLCSLYRVSMYNENDVFVVLGYPEVGDGHAWVKINFGLLGWVNIEPQLNGILSIIWGIIDISTYDTVYEFNDVYFKVLK